MKNFKEMLDKDLDRTFYNTEEFAELQRVRIDGIDTVSYTHLTLPTT